MPSARRQTPRSAARPQARRAWDRERSSVAPIFSADPHQRIAGIDRERRDTIEHDPAERRGDLSQGIAEVVAQLTKRLALANGIAGAHYWIPAGGMRARHNLKCAQQRDRLD